MCHIVTSFHLCLFYQFHFFLCHVYDPPKIYYYLFFVIKNGYLIAAYSCVPFTSSSINKHCFMLFQLTKTVKNMQTKESFNVNVLCNQKTIGLFQGDAVC